MSIQANRQITDIIISYANDPYGPKGEKMGSEHREIITGFFDNRSTNINAFEIEKAFECPLSLVCFEDTVITPCGHTFGSQYLYQYLEQANAKCPVDRRQITQGSLRPNHIVTELTKSVQKLLSEREKLIKVFIKFTNRGIDPYLDVDCITKCLLTDAVVLPCGHTYNMGSIGTKYDAGRHSCQRFPLEKFEHLDLQSDVHRKKRSCDRITRVD